MAHPYSVPSPIVTISGLDGTLIITPMSITTGALQRFQIASWRGGSQLGLLHARALLRAIQFDTSAMSDLRQLFAAVHETAPPQPFGMVQLLTYELYWGGKFHAFYIPPSEFGHFAVAKAPDLSGLLADPPGPPAGWSIQARIAAMLRRVPGQVVPELKAQVAKLLDPKSIALLAIFLSALAVAQAYGVGEIVDAILVGLAWWAARWAGLLAVKDIVTSIIEAGTAQRLPAIDEAAGRFARALLVLGLVFLSKLIERAGDEENVSGFPEPQPKEPPAPLRSSPRTTNSRPNFSPQSDTETTSLTANGTLSNVENATIDPTKLDSYDLSPEKPVATEGGVTVTQEGLDNVVSHLSQFGENGINSAMIDRLTGQVGSQVTGADANFYTHELLESEFMGSGMDYDAAHAAALDQAGVSPFSLYHPDVIQQFPDYFNSNWRTYWGLQ